MLGSQEEGMSLLANMNWKEMSFIEFRLEREIK